MYRADGRCANLAHFEAPVFVGACVVDLVGAAVEVVVLVASVHNVHFVKYLYLPTEQAET